MVLSFFIRDMVVLVVRVGGCAGAERTQDWPDSACLSVRLYTHSQGPFRLWSLVGRGEGACRVEPVIGPCDNGNQGLVGLQGAVLSLPPTPLGLGGVLVTVSQNPRKIGAQPWWEVIPVSRSALSLLVSESQTGCAIHPCPMVPVTHGFCDSWISSKEAVVTFTWC